MGGIYVLALMFTAIGAVLSVPIFYLWAWAAGPAVKYLGRKWAEGEHEAIQTLRARVEESYVRGIEDVVSGKVKVSAPIPAGRYADRIPAPAIPAQYTITGKPIR